VSYNSSTEFGPGPNVNCGTEMLYKIDFSNPPIVLPNTCSSGTCTNLTSNLPNSGAGAICLEKMSAGAIYLATDQGVFFTNSNWFSTHGWFRFGDVPHIGGSGIDINYKINKIRVSQFGRGVWERNLYCSQHLFLTFGNSTVASSYFWETRGDITSQSMIATATTIDYRAGNMITLQAGFSAAQNCAFHAFIHDCDGSSNSFLQREGGNDNENEGDQFIEGEEEVTIFPNPSTGQFSIALLTVEEEDEAELRQISVFDINGHLVADYNMKGVHNFQLDLKDQPAGIYFARVTTNEKTYTKRIIIFSE
ncbi:MAG: T9SS type A sorting domain-containing protein, partial [Bacteroidota bacterium]|nr:T9SS type A sorting domain-containing protein [Bacteroidota bacterium]